MKVDSMQEVVSEDEDKDMSAKLLLDDDYNGVYMLIISNIALLLFLAFILFHYFFYSSLYSDQVLFFSLCLMILYDFILRTLFCFFFVLVYLLHMNRKRTSYAKIITKIQIYEVFEEHIKFGINCLDDDYYIQQEQSNLDDYSLISYNLQDNSTKNILPKSKVKSHKEDGIYIILNIHRALVFKRS